MLPALAIVVALWFERVCGCRRAARGDCVGAGDPDLRRRARHSDRGVHSHQPSRGRDGDRRAAARDPRRRDAGRVARDGGGDRVARLELACARTFSVRRRAALVLFIAFVAEPAAEALKPIPPIAQRDRRAACARFRRRDPRGVAGTYALIFYTEPGVLTLDEAMPRSRGDLRHPDLFLVARAPDVPRLYCAGRRARAAGRRAPAPARHRRSARRRTALR